MKIATYGIEFGIMERHDQSPRSERMKSYAGLGGNYVKRDYDPNWNKSVKQARLPRYKLTPVLLRRMGIGR